MMALKVRSLSSSLRGAGLDFRDSPLLFPKSDLSPLLLLLLVLLLLFGGRGLLLPSLFRLESELLDEPSLGDPLDFDIDFDVLLEPEDELLFSKFEDEDEEDDAATAEGVLDDGLELVLIPELDVELPLLPLPLDGILGRPGDDDDWGFFDAGPLLTPGLRPV